MMIETSPVNLSLEFEKENLPRGGLLVVSATERQKMFVSDVLTSLIMSVLHLKSFYLHSCPGVQKSNVIREILFYNR